MEKVFTLIAIIIFIVRIINSFTKNSKKTPEPTQPTQQKPQNKQVKSLEDLLNEFVEKEQQKQKAETYETLESNSGSLEKTTTKYINYEEQGMLNYEEIDYEDPKQNYKGLTQNDLKDEHLNPYRIAKRSSKTRFSKMLRSKKRVKDAIILNEVLTRRF